MLQCNQLRCCCASRPQEYSRDRGIIYMERERERLRNRKHWNTRTYIESYSRTLSPWQDTILQFPWCVRIHIEMEKGRYGYGAYESVYEMLIHDRLWNTRVELVLAIAKWLYRRRRGWCITSSLAYMQRRNHTWTHTWTNNNANRIASTFMVTMTLYCWWLTLSIARRRDRYTECLCVCLSLMGWVDGMTPRGHNTWW